MISGSFETHLGLCCVPIPRHKSHRPDFRPQQTLGRFVGSICHEHFCCWKSWCEIRCASTCLTQRPEVSLCRSPKIWWCPHFKIMEFMDLKCKWETLCLVFESEKDRTGWKKGGIGIGWLFARVRYLGKFGMIKTIWQIWTLSGKAQLPPSLLSIPDHIFLLLVTTLEDGAGWDFALTSM